MELGLSENKKILTIKSKNQKGFWLKKVRNLCGVFSPSFLKKKKRKKRKWETKDGKEKMKMTKNSKGDKAFSK